MVAKQFAYPCCFHHIGNCLLCICSYFTKGKYARVLFNIIGIINLL